MEELWARVVGKSEEKRGREKRGKASGGIEMTILPRIARELLRGVVQRY